MWQPPERRKHALPAPRWPTAEQAAASRWASSIALGPKTSRTRTWVPAMVPWRATEDGQVTREVIDWYARFAEGRPGVLVIEATGIRDVPSGPLLRIGHDRFVDGLRDLTRRGAAASAADAPSLHPAHRLPRRAAPAEPRRYFGVPGRHERHRALAARDGDLLRWAAPTRPRCVPRSAAPDAELAAVLTPRELEALQRG
jgi:2,4-dienoyl-CoA reductase-like NADH-dependent reductase (Old Yellow Enzyme family)